VAASIGELLATAAARLAANHESARLEAEILLGHVLAVRREQLLTWPERVPDDAARARFEELVQRRLAGAPVAHLVGRREFWSLPLEVTVDTLIPRPETELLVERALALLGPDEAVRVADLGTGTGAVAIAVALERPRARVVATDVSEAALEVAARNVARLAPGRVALAHGDWCEPLAEAAFELVLSNPPYVAEGDPHLFRGDVAREPRIALSAGQDGLDAVRLIAATVAPCLVPRGHLLLEHGHDQATAVHTILEDAGFLDVRLHRDLAGLARVTEARAR
jgi:release factor glutamine methyltransferase